MQSDAMRRSKLKTPRARFSGNPLTTMFERLALYISYAIPFVEFSAEWQFSKAQGTWSNLTWRNLTLLNYPTLILNRSLTFL